MVFSQKKWIIVGSVAVFLVVGTVVGVTLGVVITRQKSQQQTIQERVHDILTQNPLIDG
jgi:uncharacterized membrane-anchored protein YhcB (DUF1043 family)